MSRLHEYATYQIVNLHSGQKYNFISVPNVRIKRTCSALTITSSNSILFIRLWFFVESTSSRTNEISVNATTLGGGKVKTKNKRVHNIIITSSSSTPIVKFTRNLIRLGTIINKYWCSGVARVRKTFNGSQRLK